MDFENIIAANKERFIALLRDNVGRIGIEDLIAWLETTDFYHAPASTRFHEAYEGGLLEHSLAVYDTFWERFMSVPATPAERETAAICTLLHDVCKANLYTVEMRNRKNEAGAWENVPYYAVNDQFPYGHGEKSVFLIERFLRLFPDEAVAYAGTWADLMMRFAAGLTPNRTHLRSIRSRQLCTSRT